MAFEKTLDLHVDIIDRTEEHVDYLSDSGERWRIIGQCNLCGACYAGAVNPLISVDAAHIGEPHAAIRLDGSPWYLTPLRPEIANLPECVLSGEYL
jgi:hypothetical protein